MPFEYSNILYYKLFELRSLGIEGDYQSPLSISRSEVGGKPALEATVAMHRLEYHLGIKV